MKRSSGIWPRLLLLRPRSPATSMQPACASSQRSSSPPHATHRPLPGRRWSTSRPSRAASSSLVPSLERSDHVSSVQPAALSNSGVKQSSDPTEREDQSRRLPSRSTSAPTTHGAPCDMNFRRLASMKEPSPDFARRPFQNFGSWWPAQRRQESSIASRRSVQPRGQPSLRQNTVSQMAAIPPGRPTLSPATSRRSAPRVSGRCRIGSASVRLTSSTNVEGRSRSESFAKPSAVKSTLTISSSMEFWAEARVASPWFSRPMERSKPQVDFSSTRQPHSESLDAHTAVERRCSSCASRRFPVSSFAKPAIECQERHSSSRPGTSRWNVGGTRSLKA